MGLMGDRYKGTFEGHTIELVRDNLRKSLSLLVDGDRVAWESRILPHDITLKGEFEHAGKKHSVVAHSTVRPILGLPLSVEDSIEIDGKLLALQKS